MPGREVDHIGRVPAGAQVGGDLLKLGVGPGLVLAVGVGVQRRAQQALDQQVARRAVERGVMRHPLFQLDVALHAQTRGEGGAEPAKIRLHRAGDQHGVRALLTGGAEIKFELANLVAAEGQRMGVVTFDVEARPADLAFEVRQPLQRSRVGREADPG